MVIRAQTPPSSKVRCSIGFVQTTDQFHTTLLEQQNVRPIGHQTISQQNISRMKHVPQSAQQADFTLAFAGISAESKIHDGPAR
jgi:hypothetical protein